VSQEQPKGQEYELCKSRRMSSAQLQQNTRQQVHARRKCVEVVDGLEQPILQIGGIAQPHPIEAEVELESGLVKQQATQHKHERDQGVLTQLPRLVHRLWACASE
jgi:hypothetical protein